MHPLPMAARRARHHWLGPALLAVTATLALGVPAVPSTHATPIGPTRTVSYDQRTIHAWDGLYGVTAGWTAPDGTLAIVSQDKYWNWSSSRGFFASGFLGQAWGESMPIVDLNASGNHHSRLEKRPWNYPGVTAAFYFHNDTDVYLVQRSRYWVYRFGTGWLSTVGFMSSLLPGAPTIGGRGPFDGPGLTGAYRHGTMLSLFSVDRYWNYNTSSNSWANWGYLSSPWASIPTVGGVHPWDSPGVTGTYYYPPSNTATIISRDKYWVFSFNTNTWTAWGYLSSAWAAMPGINAGWAQPIGGDPNSSWRITEHMGACASGFGCGHLAQDIQRVEGDDASVGQAISAAAEGKVTTVLPTCGNYYNVVVIEHMVPDINDDYAPIYSFYGHVIATSGLHEGQWVARGQTIGTLPDPRPTYGFGPHVHFEIKDWYALLNQPFSTCYTNIPANQTYGRYISAGYSGTSFTEPVEYYDLPALSGQPVPRRYYNPTKFCENRGGGALT
jgi:murein DD-endopeptidase MepM/ murein hydrolase activator NlpD